MKVSIFLLFAISFSVCAFNIDSTNAIRVSEHRIENAKPHSLSAGAIIQPVIDKFLEGMDTLAELLRQFYQPIIDYLQQQSPFFRNIPLIRSNMNAILKVIRKSIDNFQKQIQNSKQYRLLHHRGNRLIGSGVGYTGVIPTKSKQLIEYKCFGLFEYIADILFGSDDDSEEEQTTRAPKTTEAIKATKATEAPEEKSEEKDSTVTPVTP